MVRLAHVVVVVSALLASSGSASACCLWPFGGWWGAGYAPVSPYGYQSAGYYPAWNGPVASGYYSAGYYSAGYGSACCATSCCDPCCGGCSTGSCGSDCSGTSSSGTLKPSTDPNFNKSDYDDKNDTRSRRSRDLDNESLDPPAPRDDKGTIDDFRNMGSTDTQDDNGMFRDNEADQINKKPPMDDSIKLDPVDDTEKKDDFLQPEGRDPQASRSRGVTLASRSSGLSEVLGPKRLASRSLLTTPVNRGSAFAGKAGSRNNAERPVRWISAPPADGQVRL